MSAHNDHVEGHPEETPEAIDAHLEEPETGEVPEDRPKKQGKLRRAFDYWQRRTLVKGNLVVPGHPMWVDRETAVVANPQTLPGNLHNVAEKRLQEITTLRDTAGEAIDEAGLVERWKIAKKIAGDGSIAVFNLIQLLFPGQRDKMALRMALYDLSEHNSDQKIKGHLKKKFPCVVRAQSGDGRETTYEEWVTLQACLLDEHLFDSVLTTESGQAMLYALLELLLDSKENAVAAGIAQAITETKKMIEGKVTKEHLEDYGWRRRLFEKAYTVISVPALTGGATTVIGSVAGVKDPVLLGFLATTGSAITALGWYLFVSTIRKKALEEDITLREALVEMAKGTGDPESKHWMDVLQRNRLMKAFLLVICLSEGASNIAGGGNTTGVVVNATNTVREGVQFTTAQGALISQIKTGVGSVGTELETGWNKNATNEAEGEGVSKRPGRKTVYAATVEGGRKVASMATEAKEKLQDPIRKAEMERFRNHFATAAATSSAALFGNENITQAVSDRLTSIEDTERLYAFYQNEMGRVQGVNEEANTTVVTTSLRAYGAANPEVLAKTPNVNIDFTKPEQHHRSTLRILHDWFGPLFGLIAFLALWLIANRLEMSTLLLTRKSRSDRERGEDALEEYASIHGLDVESLTPAQRTKALKKTNKKGKKTKENLLKRGSHAEVQLIQAPTAEDLTDILQTGITTMAHRLHELQDAMNLQAILHGFSPRGEEDFIRVICAQIDSIAFPKGGKFSQWWEKRFGDTSVGYQPLEHVQARYAAFYTIMNDAELRSELITQALFRTDQLREAKRTKDLESMLTSLVGRQNGWERERNTGTFWEPGGGRITYNTSDRITAHSLYRSDEAEGLDEADAEYTSVEELHPRQEPPKSDIPEPDGDDTGADQTADEPELLSDEEIALLQKDLYRLRDIVSGDLRREDVADDVVQKSYDRLRAVMADTERANFFAASPLRKPGSKVDQVIASIKRTLGKIKEIYKFGEAEEQLPEEDEDKGEERAKIIAAHASSLVEMISATMDIRDQDTQELQKAIHKDVIKNTNLSSAEENLRDNLNAMLGRGELIAQKARKILAALNKDLE